MSRRRSLVVALVVAFALAVGCDPNVGQSGPSDEATMAVLGTARALHHQADVYEGAGDYERAAQSIERVLALPFPRGMAEAEDLRADAYGRLAEIALRAGAPDQSLARANTGIADARRESVLRARLFMVRGQALGALADRAAASGDTNGAAQRRAEAITSLETSIEINQRVLHRLVDGGAP